MAKLFRNEPFREKLLDTFLSIIGGIIGALMVNIAFPATGGIYLLILFVLPGTLVGCLIGFFLSPLIGRGFATLASGGASFIIVLVLLLLLLAKTID